MAEKLVQLGKTMSVGLSTPTERDITKLNANEKKTTTRSGLWTHEGRMFNEKVVYLNKSTTKYVIIGIHPINFEPTIMICDRVTGAYLCISSLERITNFKNLVRKLVASDDTYEIEAKAAGVRVDAIPSACLWRLTSGYVGLSMHRVSLDNFLLVADCILQEVHTRCNGERYKEFIGSLQQYIAERNMTPKQKWDYLNELQVIALNTESKHDYRVLSDLIFNRAQFMCMDEYVDFYITSTKSE